MEIERLMNDVVRFEHRKAPDGRTVFENEDCPGKKLGMYFVFQVQMAHYQDGLQGERRAFIHMFFYWQKYSAISTFSAVTQSAEMPAKWTHEVTHDSCWRDYKPVTAVYFQFARELCDELKINIAPKDFNQFVSLPWNRKDLFTWVPCKVEMDPADPHRYRRIPPLDT